MVIFCSFTGRKRISTPDNSAACLKQLAKPPKPPSPPPLAANVADVAAITLTHDFADKSCERAGIFNT
jgi:hypothetical protein